MAFRRARHNIGGEGGHGDDLMITPLLDLLTALLPFLIMSSVLLHINVAEVGISKPVAASQVTPDNGFDLSLRISEKSADIVLRGRVLKSVSRDTGTVWIDGIHSELVNIKRQNPDEYRIRIEPSGNVTLDSLMGLMDAARNLNKTDAEITRKDAKGQLIKLQYLFPNIVLRGVYG